MEVVDLISRRITREMNEDLTKEFQKKEVIQAIRQMHPTNAPNKKPSLDGMFAIFYQNYWDTIGEDLIKNVLNILNFNALITELNKTNIALIPKINNLTKISEFRPISLCNVSYKIVSKVLANRLKPLLSTIISES